MGQAESDCGLIGHVLLQLLPQAGNAWGECVGCVWCCGATSGMLGTMGGVRPGNPIIARMTPWMLIALNASSSR
jgi:hypothetical protein